MKTEDLTCFRPREAARYLKVSLPTLRRETKKGRIPHIRLGPRTVRYPKFRLDEFLAGEWRKSL